MLRRCASADCPVDYVSFEDEGNSGDFTGELQRAIVRHAPQRVIVTEPGEWRVLDLMRNWQSDLELPVLIRPDDRFLCSRDDFAAWAQDRKLFRMEHFYREMRKRTGLLMEDGKPAGGDVELRYREPEGAAQGQTRLRLACASRRMRSPAR